MSEKRWLKDTVFLDIGLSDLYPISTGSSECDGGHTAYGMRDYYMIHYVREGRGTLFLEGAVYEIGAGDIFIIRKHADAVYKADTEEPWKYSWICFDGTFASRLDSVRPVMTVSSRPFDMLEPLPHRSDTREEIAVAALYLILADILKGAEAKRPPYTKQAQDIIHNLYMREITVMDIARELGLDRRYLSRLFHAEAGVSVKEYLTRVRIEAAKKHLLSGRSVALAAELVGYSDPFNFSKIFKKYVGISPRGFVAQKGSDT